MSDDIRPWADPHHPGNKLRPKVKCMGCGRKGCVTAWGPWCFECNCKRMARLTTSFDELRRYVT